MWYHTRPLQNKDQIYLKWTIFDLKLDSCWTEHQSDRYLNKFLLIPIQPIGPLLPCVLFCTYTRFPGASEARPQCDVWAQLCSAAFWFGFVLLFCHERLAGGCLVARWAAESEWMGFRVAGVGEQTHTRTYASTHDAKIQMSHSGGQKLSRPNTAEPPPPPPPVFYLALSPSHLPSHCFWLCADSLTMEMEGSSMQHSFIQASVQLATDSLHAALTHISDEIKDL